MDASLADEYSDIVRYIESIETEERIKCHPHLTQRAPNMEMDDVQRLADAAAAAAENANNTASTASLSHQGLKEFSLSLLSISTSIEPALYMNLTKLDVSNNEISILPGIAFLCNLEILCIKRNWFNALPSEIGQLKKLREIDASRNFINPNDASLRFDDLKSLPYLKVLNVSLNQKCRTAEHLQFINNNLLLPPTPTATTKTTTTTPTTTITPIQVLITIWQENPSVERNCIGASAAQRDPNLLRSQLEPWGTVNLRRRLVRDFGSAPTDPAVVDRAGVMEALFCCYREEGLLHFSDHDDGDVDVGDGTRDGDGDTADLNMGIGKRRTIEVNGTPVRPDLLDEILAELRDWRGNVGRGGSRTHRERLSIHAECYMILRAPTGTPPSESSRREKRRHKKMDGNAKLWELALRALHETDPVFAARCSEIAVTFGFTGSPHIDQQNSSPFYGLALGEFEEGTGGVMVECSPRVLARVNTKDRLGRVDGRHPHWVDGYDGGEERFSLIYYDTLSAFQTPGPAIFSIP